MQKNSSHTRQATPGSPAMQMQPTEDIVFGDAVVPFDIIHTALQGALLDLSKFLVTPNPVAVHDTITLHNGKLSVTSNIRGQLMTSASVWLSAWAIYEEVLIRYLPSEFDIYRQCNT